MKKIAVIIPFVLLLSACATKQYPQAAAVSGEESALMNCHDIKTEIAKTRSIQQDIEKTGEFDGKTILGFLGILVSETGLPKGMPAKKSLPVWGN